MCDRNRGSPISVGKARRSISSDRCRRRLTGGLPRRRLIWIARVPDCFVVHYEHGGIGLGYHVLVVRSYNRFHSANVVWYAAGPRLASYNDFIKAIGENKLDDTLPYYH